MHSMASAKKDEMNKLKSRVIVSKSSSLPRLDPMLIEDLLCVGGRLKHATLSDEGNILSYFKSSSTLLI